MRILRGVLLVLASILIITYLGISIFFMTHFYPDTTLNGEDVSMKSEEYVENIFAEKASHYVLKVTGRNDLSMDIKASDISFKPDFEGQIGQLIKEQNAFLWIAALARPSELTAESLADFSSSELHELIDASDFFKASNISQPKDAYYDLVDGAYAVIPDEPGTDPVKEEVYKVIEGAVSSLDENVSIDRDECYTKAAIRADDPVLNETVNNLNKYCGTKIRFDFGEDSEVLDGNTIKDWVTLEGTQVTFDPSYIKEYVAGLARRHDTFGMKREFTTSRGKKITVSGGDYGWWTDRPSTIEEVTKAIENTFVGDMEPVYFGRAMVHGDSDIGSSYVEVDLDNQHVYVYKDGNLVTETDCVSGKAVNGNSTPEGTYGITYKERDAELVGENYTSPVNYWMPFNGNVGLHDATWRKEFGGSIYINSGSHGCVNLPLDKAKIIFENVVKGEPVIVYGGKKKEDVVKEKEEEQPSEEQLQLQELLTQIALNAAAQQEQAQEQTGGTNEANGTSQEGQ
ncbi:MAG: L,D-transpeptidase family protein [Lachnospiraceae bacterium]|nr:L,D-transpeptidase family protein [Lachnospiraceae bacterium]